MKIPVLLTMLLAFIVTGHAQQLDSLKYPNGYLYFHTYGAGSPVIVLSGGPGNSCLQQEEVAIELGRKYRAILPEQRGTGLSIPVPFDSTTITLQSAVEDLYRLLQHLHLKQAIFYGHSWGAMLAMSFAARYPDEVRALVLVDPGYYKFSADLLTTHVNNLRSHLGVADVALWDSLGKKIAAGKGTAEDSARYNRTIRLGYIYNKSLIDSLMVKIYAAKPNGTMQQLMVSDLNRVHYDLSKNLFHYKGPVSIIAGAQDALAFYTYELKVIRPAIQLYWIQQSGHFPMFEQPTAFNKQLWAVMAAWP
ncbi:alpha/beta fold hydrolase [Chitinophaga eiseniae]|uniref:Alpha/beta hydrolase n=1 Tax=Chitinophaga eiseniae TaxID=634771 RepID=A0A847SB14_9BACT|nr:alpha/beta hydrolase [Chitinophaga eiseniae]NLR80400.1 alpha/beta hydrolase [Chitinophaga eiseniae]